MKRPALYRAAIRALVLAVMLQANTHADTIPAPGVIDPRVRTTVYRADDVVHLDAVVGFQIDLEFAGNERFVGLAAGDLEGIGFETTVNHLFIKPKAARLATNLTILTDRRAYQIEYRAQRNTRAATDRIYALRFLYPEDEAVRVATLAAVAAQAGAAQQLTRDLRQARAPINIDYAYCGPRSLRPDAASDDGVQTRLVFGSRAEWPAVFVRNDDGTESLVNFTVTSDTLLIHRIARQFILRRGKLVACVVNRHFDGSGERLPSGTTSSSVERTAPGVAP
jgi:type IV secretion system protein VirB9